MYFTPFSTISCSNSPAEIIDGFTILSLMRMANRLSVYPPNASQLKKLPQRPMICPVISPNTPLSAMEKKDCFRTFVKIRRVSTAPITPP